LNACEPSSIRQNPVLAAKWTALSWSRIKVPHVMKKRPTPHHDAKTDDESRKRKSDRNQEDEQSHSATPHKKRKKRKKQTSRSLLFGLILGVGLLLLLLAAGGATGLYFMLRKPATNNVINAHDKKTTDIVAVSEGKKTADVPVDSQGKKSPVLPTGWQEINSSEGRFRAAMPGPFFVRKRAMQSPAGPVLDYQYLHELSNDPFTYSITYLDFTDAQIQKAPPQKTIDAGRDTIAKELNGKLITDKKIEFEGRTGREMVIEAPPDYRMILRYYIDNRRLYTVMLVGPNATHDCKEARAFFGSFHFVDANSP
jgi:hypothetical protein